jgi:hypothetical protein
VEVLVLDHCLNQATTAQMLQQPLRLAVLPLQRGRPQSMQQVLWPLHQLEL